MAKGGEARLIKEYKIDVDYLACHVGTDLVRAKIAVDTDLSELLPYLNAVAEKAKFLPKFNWIRFIFRGYPPRPNGFWEVAIKEGKISVKNLSR